MLTKMRNSLLKAWNLVLSSLTAASPGLSADEQTRSTWAKAIESFDAIPGVYKEFFKPFLADGKIFPYTVLTPSYEKLIHPTTEKLICDLGSDIYVLERDGNTYTVQCYPIEGISYVEIGTILLYSWIKISGVGSHGDLISSTLKFNSVTDYLFKPILERIRPAAANSGDATPNSESEKFDHLVLTNYKFMNYAKYSLLAGEKVIHTILQPEIRAGIQTFLGKIDYRIISPAHMSILTDRELIMIREDTSWSEKTRYGGIWDYIPLTKIISLSLSGKGSNLLILSIHLPESAHLDFVFQASAKRDLDQLMEQFYELTPLAADRAAGN
jgi:hypothetical protein